MRTIKLAMAQMSMSVDLEENLKKVLDFMEKAKDSDFIFFPELMLSPFLPQYHRAELPEKIGHSADEYLVEKDSIVLAKLARKAWQLGLGLSPNIFLLENGNNYDANLMMSQGGVIEGTSKMVNVVNQPQFYETEFYTPSEDGYQVFETEYGKIGIVICYDRHVAGSVTACKEKGAELVIIPTANCKAEPMDQFEEEVRTLARENEVPIAMCNRVGLEGDMDFAGESIIVDAKGEVLLKAGDKEELIQFELEI